MSHMSNGHILQNIYATLFLQTPLNIFLLASRTAFRDAPPVPSPSHQRAVSSSANAAAAANSVSSGGGSKRSSINSGVGGGGMNSSNNDHELSTSSSADQPLPPPPLPLMAQENIQVNCVQTCIGRLDFILFCIFSKESIR